MLFLTLVSIENIYERGIYNDLIRELADRDINIYVVCPRERRTGFSTELFSENKINILKVRTGNITKTNFIEKGISTFLIEWQYKLAIKKYYKNIHFDMVMYSTPPITFERLIKYFKVNQNSITYLILKDIFPQNAVDLNIIKKSSFIYKYFRKKEKKLYKLSDYIGCMTEGNLRYILTNNNFLNKSKVEVFPNSIIPIERIKYSDKDVNILKKYNVPENITLFVYGGSLGKPQGIDFLLEIIKNFNKVTNGYLFIVGYGTEYKRIMNFIENIKPNNVSLYNMISKKDYDQLLQTADVGLIFLEKKFTIPNFPSRLTAYMEHSLPVIAATDKNTDLKDVLLESESGFWCESGDLESFVSFAKELSLDKDLRILMGINGRRYLEKHYDIRKTIDTIIKHL
ncbi:MAG: glycosyltransferase family 4 protein [Clostridiaceae bacterium]